MDHRPDILIDFDGTIHDWQHPEPGHRMGPPIRNSAAALTLLSKRYRIVIFTVRGNHPYIAEWLTFFHIPFDAITNIKVPGKIIDDNAIHFDGDWDHALAELDGRVQSS